MPLKLMYITNDCAVAQIAEQSGVDRIFVDLEYIGKSIRQGGMDTVQSNHTIDDVRAIKRILNKSELLVRVNPIHNATADYTSSEEEIESVINAGADIIMLPYFKTVEEVKSFLHYVGGRVRTMLLFETPQAVENAEEILKLPGIDEVYVGLNDLSLGYGKKFMFELLADGTVESLAALFREKDIPFGFGGIAAIGKGLLPAEYIICEHYRLGSSCVILSRSFCDLRNIDMLSASNIFINGVASVRESEQRFSLMSQFDFAENHRKVLDLVKQITQKLL